MRLLQLVYIERGEGVSHCQMHMPCLPLHINRTASTGYLYRRKRVTTVLRYTLAANALWLA